MKDGKCNVLGVLVDPVDYRTAIDRIVHAAEGPRPLSVSALAVHGVVEGVLDGEHRWRLNHLDLVAPDGQPVRWALNWLHRARLRDRVYGPRLTRELCAIAAERGIPVYFYGSRREIVERVAATARDRFRGLVVAGAEPSRFRVVDPAEKAAIARRIRESGARIVFVGLGCPRQEVFAYEFRDALGVPVIAVGAAFDFIAGVRAEPPAWVQDRGLQWLHRLAQEPRRLWRRYLGTNLTYSLLLLAQLLGIWRPDPARCRPPRREVRCA